MKLYNVIYADPPWDYDNKKIGGNMTSGASQKYPCIPTEDLMKMPIPKEKDGVLYLWVTIPFLEDGLCVLRAWGYTYKTKLTWIKEGRLGTGWWYRGNTEDLLVGIRGQVTPFRMPERNWYASIPGPHSEKPAYYRGLIDRSVDLTFEPLKKLEMFARQETPGWDVHGNQVKNSIII